MMKTGTKYLMHWYFYLCLTLELGLDGQTSIVSLLRRWMSSSRIVSYSIARTARALGDGTGLECGMSDGVMEGTKMDEGQDQATIRCQELINSSR